MRHNPKCCTLFVRQLWSHGPQAPTNQFDWQQKLNSCQGEGVRRKSRRGSDQQPLSGRKAGNTHERQTNSLIRAGHSCHSTTLDNSNKCRHDIMTKGISHKVSGRCCKAANIHHKPNVGTGHKAKGTTQKAQDKRHKAKGTRQNTQHKRHRAKGTGQKAKRRHSPWCQ